MVLGLGTFSRLLSIAGRIKKLDEEVDFDILHYDAYIPSSQERRNPCIPPSGRKKFNDMPAKMSWNKIVEENIANVFAIHKPSMFIFDGAFPYRGMLNSIQGRDEIKKVWLRRAIQMEDTKIPVDSINHFDYIITPEG